MVVRYIMIRRMPGPGLTSLAILSYRAEPQLIVQTYLGGLVISLSVDLTPQGHVLRHVLLILEPSCEWIPLLAIY
jgi:hypothetical protein